MDPRAQADSQTEEGVGRLGGQLDDGLAHAEAKTSDGTGGIGDRFDGVVSQSHRWQLSPGQARRQFQFCVDLSNQ
jgi:hypothetical protein